MHKISLGGKHERNFPEHIGEFTQDQYIYYIQLVLMLHAGHITLLEFKTLLVYHILGLKYTGKTNDDSLCALAQLVELTESFFEVTEKGVSPVLEYPANLIKRIKLGIREFKGPADALADINLKQFVRGLEIAESFRKDPDEKYLVKLISHFYLRVSPGNRVAKYSEEQAQRNEQYLARLKPAVLYGFYYFFKSAVKFLTTEQLQLDDGREYDFSPLFNEASDKGESIGPASVLFTLSENKVFGDIEKTGEQNIIECLIYMLSKHYESEKLRAKYKKNDHSN